MPYLNLLPANIIWFVTKLRREIQSCSVLAHGIQSPSVSMDRKWFILFLEHGALCILDSHWNHSLYRFWSWVTIDAHPSWQLPTEERWVWVDWNHTGKSYNLVTDTCFKSPNNRVGCLIELWGFHCYQLCSILYQSLNKKTKHSLITESEALWVGGWFSQFVACCTAMRTWLWSLAPWYKVGYGGLLWGYVTSQSSWIIEPPHARDFPWKSKIESSQEISWSWPLTSTHMLSYNQTNCTHT